MQAPASGIFHSTPALVFVMISAVNGAKFQIGLRFVHVLAGILWVGLLYFFTLVNLPFMRDLDSATRLRIYPRLMRPALWWFRWASVVTVLIGIWYWMIIIGEDKAGALATGIVPHPGRAIGSFFGIWTAVSFVMIGVFMMGKLNGRGPVLAVIFALLVAGAAWLYLALNSTGWESNRQLCIGVGGGIGWVMMNNVWGVLWRAQKRILQWTQSAPNPSDAAPPEIQKLMLLTAVTARTNFCLSFPMLFFMVSASHYVLFVAH
jgi:uncharacterized membrane protein